MAVSVTVARSDIEKWQNCVHVGAFVSKRLREAGVPISDGCFPTSVERGHLTIEEDAFGDLVVTWDES